MSVSGSAAPLQGIGRAQKGLFITETAFETIAALSGTRFDFLSFDAKLEQERAERVDKRQYPGLFETICRKQGITYGIEAYLLPSGTAGTAPDIDLLLEAIGFTGTNVPATSETYALRNGVSSFSLLRDSENVSELLHGCLGEEMKISFDGTDDAKIAISGKASDMKRTGTTTLGAILNATDTTATVTEAEYFEVGGYIQFVGDAGPYKVTAINTATNVITFTPAAATGAANGSTVSPVIPTGSTAGTVVCGNFGSLTVGGNTLTATSGEITLTNNIWTTDGIFGRNRYSSNFALTDRRVAFSFDLYADNVNLLEYFRSRSTNGTGTSSTALALALGTSAGSICTVNLPKSQFDVVPLNVPDEDGNMIQITGKALASSSGNDEMNMVFA